MSENTSDESRLDPKPDPQAPSMRLRTGWTSTIARLSMAALLFEAVSIFPKDYSFLYGTNRRFAPSLARTDTGGAFDSRSLAGSMTCGTAGCHGQIVQEWKPSAHRYAAMDTVFHGIQDVMAKQNGPESTRYCGGCHDPISLFSGTKNIFAENLTGLQGYQEGISCLACHAIRETDVKGNANYTVTQPHEYLWQWADRGAGRLARDFLIRAYPAEHNRLGKRAFKKPEYCAACHKQFIDQEVNRVGWVQLQNQYDNWAASHWNHKGDPRKTLECRECHMPLVTSTDPAAYSIAVSLHYRKVDQFLLNFLFGEKTKLNSPVTEIARATATVTVRAARKEAAAPAPARLATLP